MAERHNSVREGVLAGIIGATAIVVWFGIIDIVSGQPFHDYVRGRLFAADVAAMKKADDGIHAGGLAGAVATEERQHAPGAQGE